MHKVIEIEPKTKGLKDAVVWLDGTPAAGNPATLSKANPVQMDQRDYCYVPHFLAVDAGQQVEFLNNDVANHGVSAASFERGATRSACAIPTAAWTAAKRLTSGTSARSAPNSVRRKGSESRCKGKSDPMSLPSRPSRSSPPPIGVRWPSPPPARDFPFCRTSEPSPRPRIQSFIAAAVELGVSQAAVSRRSPRSNVSSRSRSSSDGRGRSASRAGKLFVWLRPADPPVARRGPRGAERPRQPVSGDLPLAAKRTVV